MFKRYIVIIGLLVMILVTLGLFACSAQTVIPTPEPSAAPSQTLPTPPPPPATTPLPVEQPALPSITAVVTQVKPAVVAINVVATTYDIFNRPVQQQGAGSGWIIRNDGYIVTNNHVVEGATKVVIVLSDGRNFPAEKIATDPVTDLAVVKINAQNLPTMVTGQNSAINVGDWVVAVGNALGQGISATKGIVSALGISLSESPGQTLHNLIQTDAAINPGNSGGPLVNMAGQVVGINSLKISQVGVEGMGYAINIDEALPIIDKLITNGSIARPYLGISVYTVDQMVAAYYSLSVSNGVLITDVATGSPADNASLKPGDVITDVDGNAETDSASLMDYINSLQIGQTVQITYVRGTTTNTVSVTLITTPQPTVSG
jgi:serine protease Do